jgi:hypothetical protein
MVACARFTGRTEKECTRREWGCPCRKEMEDAFHAMRVEDIPVLAEMVPEMRSPSSRLPGTPAKHTKCARRSEITTRRLPPERMLVPRVTWLF